MIIRIKYSVQLFVNVLVIMICCCPSNFLTSFEVFISNFSDMHFCFAFIMVPNGRIDNFLRKEKSLKFIYVLNARVEDKLVLVYEFLTRTLL
jgi:ABC-type uncharacterized transport system permease subunit